MSLLVDSAALKAKSSTSEGAVCMVAPIILTYETNPPPLILKACTMALMVIP